MPSASHTFAFCVTYPLRLISRAFHQGKMNLLFSEHLQPTLPPSLLQGLGEAGFRKRKLKAPLWKSSQSPISHKHYTPRETEPRDWSWTFVWNHQAKSNIKRGVTWQQGRTSKTKYLFLRTSAALRKPWICWLGKPNYTGLFPRWSSGVGANLSATIPAISCLVCLMLVA